MDSARSDVKNAVTAIEAFSAANGGYPQIPFTMTGPGSYSCVAQSGGGGTCSASTGSGGDFNISAGNKITVTADSSCTNGYTISGYNSNIDSGSSATPVSYNSCTGQYYGF